MGSKRTSSHHQACFARTLFGAFILLLTPCLAVAVTEIHLEEFTSTALRDPVWTTAEWDTVVGEIRLESQGLAPLGFYNTSGNAFASAAASGALLVADGSGGLLSLDISDPLLPAVLDEHAALDQARDIALKGDLAVLAIGGSGVQIIDATDPAGLAPRGSADVPGYVTSVSVSGNWIYAAQSNLGIAVVDGTDPDDPLHITDVPTNDWARGVAVMGSHIAVADGNAGLTILDAAVPSAPVLLANLPTAGTVLDVTVSGTRAYLAAGSAGLIIVDVSNPALPLELGSLALSGTCRHAVASGDSLWVAAGSAGLFLVDVADPADPLILEHRDTLGEAYHTTALAGQAWLCDGAEGVLGFEADPLGLDPALNVARSLNINPAGDLVPRARLSGAYTDSVKFELSNNGGGTWTEVLSGEDWTEFGTPGTDLRWRATLVQTGPYPGPVLSSLTVTFERVLNSAEIISVTDIAQDTGGQVRVRWAASRFDTLGASPQVTEYSVYRRYSVAKLYPPGDWDFLLTIPADQETEYAVVAPTLADSSAAGIPWSAFFVRARTTTEGLFYDSPVDSGYSVNNLQPPPPTGFRALYLDPGFRLNWDMTAIPDFSHFALYRADSPLIPPQPGTLLTVTLGTTFTDNTPGLWYYKLTVVDQQGRQSDPADAVQPSAVPPTGALTLCGSPNPFNPQITIDFEIPEGGSPVNLEIYDARGRLVAVVCRETLPAGRHRRTWDGRDSAGRSVASGSYTGLLRWGAHRRRLPMTLVR